MKQEEPCKEYVRCFFDGNEFGDLLDVNAVESYQNLMRKLKLKFETEIEQRDSKGQEGNNGDCDSSSNHLGDARGNNGEYLHDNPYPDIDAYFVDGYNGQKIKLTEENFLISWIEVRKTAKEIRVRLKN